MKRSFLITVILLLLLVPSSCIRRPKHPRVPPVRTPHVTRNEDSASVPRVVLDRTDKDKLEKGIHNLAETTINKISRGQVSQPDLDCWTDLYKEYYKDYLKSIDRLSNESKTRIEYNLEIVDKVIIQNPVAGSVQWTNYSDEGFNLPVFTYTADRRYSQWYADGNTNLKMLEEACDYNLPYTKAFSNHLAARHPGVFSLEQAFEIFNFCYSRWRYVNDPKVGGSDYVARASESIAASLTGDCDDFAVLIASCIFSIGGNARIVTASNSANEGHAYAELDVTNFNKSDIISTIRSMFPSSENQSVFTRQDDGKIWLNLDWQANYPGGNYWPSVEQDIYYIEGGRWKWHK